MSNPFSIKKPVNVHHVPPLQQRWFYYARLSPDPKVKALLKNILEKGWDAASEEKKE